MQVEHRIVIDRHPQERAHRLLGQGRSAHPCLGVGAEDRGGRLAVIADVALRLLDGRRDLENWGYYGSAMPKGFLLCETFLVCNGNQPLCSPTLLE
jgi:hypothetical protein